MPLWFDGVLPEKLNLGLAYYGRTYKLSNPSCGKMGCDFIPGQGGSPGSCTAFPGLLTNREIKQIISAQVITPYLNETAMVKYFTYDNDSWIGYDDKETYALKEGLANNRCLGGTMIWSVDFNADERGGQLANSYISPDNATVVPMAHTTVPSGSTFTIDAITSLPNNGDQNSPQGPGPSNCSRCSFFRRVPSTCCGSGGSIGNPMEIAPGLGVQ